MIAYTLRTRKICKAFVEKTEADPPTWWVRVAGSDGYILPVKNEEVALATLRLQMEQGEYIVKGLNGGKVE